MVTKTFADSTMEVVGKFNAHSDSGEETLPRENVDHDTVFSIEEQRRIIRRM